jgi:hypothetical protein
LPILPVLGPDSRGSERHGAVGVEEDLVPGPESVEISETRHAALPSGMMTQWREAPFEATASATRTASTSWGAVGIAVKKI